jgi:UDP-N-acetylmuramoyl-tripeptide--D-alanyl-D-alanine ligase
MVITMKHMTLAAIANACNGQLVMKNDCPKGEVTGVVLDSRKVEKDNLFIATVGEHVDGHDFIDNVFDNGAIAVVCEKAPLHAKGPYILVADSLAALKDIAEWYRMQLTIKVVGITGSVGKTSTKELISGVLERKYHVLKTEGNFNNEIGLPLTILKIRDTHEIAVLEMGISNFGEMHRLSKIAKPDICVMTNIGQCHLENLKSRQGILKAKTEIFDFMKEDGSVCINGDDDMLSTIEKVKGKKPVTFGKGTGNDVYADQIVSKGLFGSTCDLHIHGNVQHVQIPLPGEHMVLNAAAAASVGTLLRMTGDEIAAGIATVQPVGGRSNIIRNPALTIIDDCYNANPVSMKAALDLLSMANTRKVAILGDMGELGVNEAALHQAVGAYAANSKTDVLICAGKLAANIAKGAKEDFDGKIFYYETQEELLDAFPSIIQKNDTVLVKASHFMKFENIVKALQE